MPNPMKCPEDITIFNIFIQRQHLYQFLVGIQDSFDKEKRDLNLEPLSTLEVAYATIRWEIARRGIMTTVTSSRNFPLKDRSSSHETAVGNLIPARQ